MYAVEGAPLEMNSNRAHNRFELILNRGENRRRGIGLELVIKRNRRCTGQPALTEAGRRGQQQQGEQEFEQERELRSITSRGPGRVRSTGAPERECSPYDRRNRPATRPKASHAAVPQGPGSNPQ